MACLSPTASLTLVTDESDTAIRASLEQYVNGNWSSGGFFSRKLSDTERRYSTYDRELLAVFAGIKHFRHQLECRRFTIKTDHKPLTYAFAQKSDKASPRQLRQLDFISQFSTDITYVKGRENAVANALSRINTIDMPTALSSRVISEEQERDGELKNLIQHPLSLKLQRHNIEDNTVYCDINDGIVRPYIPASLRRTAFNIVHGLLHPSGRTTARTLQEKDTWPEINKDAIKWSRECLQCQQAKVQRHNRLTPQEIEIPDARFNHIHLDLILLPPVDGYRYCLIG